MTKTAIRVINLPDSINRRLTFRRMTDTTLEWAFSPAYFAITEPLQYDDRSANKHIGRSLSTTEIGCYVSHFKLWEWLASSDYDQAIIFEDDVIVDWPVIEKITDIDCANLGIDILRLYVSYPFKSKKTKLKLFTSNFSLVELTGLTLGCQSYLLTKSAARKLVSDYTSITMPVDWVIARYWEHSITNYCLYPFPVIERLVPSTIGEDCRKNMPSYSLYDQLARFGYRIVNRVRRARVDWGWT